MPLHLLAATLNLCAYHDTPSDVLFLDLEGQLTIAEVQAMQGQVAQLAQHQRYAQVLFNACDLSFPTDSSLRTLTQPLLADLARLGVHQLAWVCRPSASHLASTHLLLTGLPIAGLFNDVEHAVTWLSRRLGLNLQNELPRLPTSPTLDHHSTVVSVL